jgi:hypothetical protein
VETITFKARPGTREKLRRINPNVSALLRQLADEIINRKRGTSALEKSKHLCGIISGPGDLSTSEDYLKQFAKKKFRSLPSRK